MRSRRGRRRRWSRRRKRCCRGPRRFTGEADPVVDFGSCGGHLRGRQGGGAARHGRAPGGVFVAQARGRSAPRPALGVRGAVPPVQPPFMLERRWSSHGQAICNTSVPDTGRLVRVVSPGSGTATHRKKRRKVDHDPRARRRRVGGAGRGPRRRGEASVSSALFLRTIAIAIASLRSIGVSGALRLIPSHTAAPTARIEFPS